MIFCEHSFRISIHPWIMQKHFWQHENNYGSGRVRKLFIRCPKMLVDIKCFCFWFWEIWNIFLHKNDYISFLLRNFHWIMWPFYTNLCHKTNNRRRKYNFKFANFGNKSLNSGWSLCLVLGPGSDRFNGSQYFVNCH